jgi:hypothetical protein
MKLSLPALALVLAAGFPLSACAQQSNAAENGPPPEVRAQMQQARDTAKTAAFNDLSAANRAKVQSIIDDVNSGKQTDLRAAAQAIDAALTPAETKAVLAERDKMMQTLRANMPPRPDGANGPGPNGAGPNGPGPNGAGPNGPGPNGAGPNGPGLGRNDVGRFLLSLGVSREKMRELRQKMQSQPPAQQ